MICGSGGSKSRLAKAAGAEPAGHRSDEKLHAVVARSTFPSQNVQNTPCSDHFWKLRRQKSARRCGAKHISKSKVLKTQGSRTTFGGSDVASLRFITLITLHYTPLHYITLHYIPQHYNYTTTQLHNYTTTQLHCTTLHYTKLHSTRLNYTTVHHTTLHYTTLHYTTLHYTPAH